MNTSKVENRIKLLGLKKSFVADKIGVSNVWFSYYLNNKKELSDEKKLLLKSYLGL
jgi:hypothetical protein|tara:strand:+ start:63 stop:230 length:168 start_codon:yes stop_codon:yes gene_type:complete